MTDLNKNTLNDAALEKVVGGSFQDAPYLYRTKVNKNTQFFDMIPNFKVQATCLVGLVPGMEVRVIEEGFSDYQNRPYVKAIIGGSKTEGFVMAADLDRLP